MRKKIPFCALLILLSCSAEKSATHQEMSQDIPEHETRSYHNDKKSKFESPGAPATVKAGQKSEDKLSERNVLKESGLNLIARVDGRKLEFSAEMTYQTKDFAESRRKILALIPKYGFVRRMQTGSSNKGYIHANISVRADKLYDLVKELDTLGDLISENIYSTDHTEKFVEKNIKSDREKLRIVRRTNAVNVNRKDAEMYLERSEDTLDKTMLDDWRISDKIAWANISLTVTGPQPPASVNVPDFRSTFVRIISGLLFLLDILLYVTPFIFVLWVIYWAVRKLIAGIKKRNVGG